MAQLTLIGPASQEARDALSRAGHRIRYGPGLSEMALLDVGPEPELVVSRLPASPIEEATLQEYVRSVGSPPLFMLLEEPSFEQARRAMQLGAADAVPSLPTDALLASVAKLIDRRQSAAAAIPPDIESAFTGVEPDELPRVIVDAACRVLEADDASLMLLGGDNRLHLAYSCGLSKSLQPNISVALGERVAGRIALSGKPTIIGGAVERDPRFEGVNQFRDLRSSIVFPLKRGDRLLGVLNLNRKGLLPPFASPDLARAAVFAGQVVLALDNVRLLRQVAADEGMAAVGRIAAAISHEINNPAGWVLSNLSFIRDELRKPKTSKSELMAAIGDATNGMHRIRDIVRDFQMLTQGEATQTIFDLNEAIRSASRVAGAVLMKAAVTLDLHADLNVVGSRSSLSQAFVNLILNAGAEESPGRRISIRSQREDGFAVATVSDTGRAFSEAQLATLFDPTFGARGPRFAGLGLSISRDIVRNHGGELLVRSQEGEGTVLTVRLPFAESQPAG